jgi:hypothetical protein
MDVRGRRIPDDVPRECSASSVLVSLLNCAVVFVRRRGGAEMAEAAEDGSFSERFRTRPDVSLGRVSATGCTSGRARAVAASTPAAHSLNPSRRGRCIALEWVFVERVTVDDAS